VWAAIVAVLMLAQQGGNAATFTAYRTYYTNGQYCPPGSLAAHLFGELRRLTNGANKSATLTATRSAAGATWNTNFLFFGCSNITGQTHWITNDANPGNIFMKTALSRVGVVTAAHTGNTNTGPNASWSNQWFLFVDRTNGQHWHRAVGAFSRYTNEPGGLTDYTVIALASPLPDTVEPMPIVFETTLSNKLANRLAEPIPVANACQHSQLISPLSGVSHGAAHGVASGDSGSPQWIVVSNRALFKAVGFSAPGIRNAAQFVADFNTVTTNAGYTTNDYPLVIEPLDQFPDL
jgi:hypothetical protein